MAHLPAPESWAGASVCEVGFLVLGFLSFPRNGLGSSPKKASKRPPVAPGQKVARFISNSHIGKPIFVKGPSSRKKASERPPLPREAKRGLERGPGRPKPVMRFTKGVGTCAGGGTG